MKDIVERLEKDKWHITTVDVEDAIAEITRLRAEAEALRKVLGRIKTHVCGDKHPAWGTDDAVYASRGYIADLCDAATKGTT